MADPISWKKNVIAGFQGQMEDLFDRFFEELENACFGPGLAAFSDWQFAEDDRELLLKVDMPEVNAEEIDLTLLGDVLTIRTVKERSVRDDTADVLTEGRGSRSTVRSLRIPCRVKRDEIEARYADGVLEIRLPKEQQASIKVSIKE
jgi:HSP20 family protein